MKVSSIYLIAAAFLTVFTVISLIWLDSVAVIGGGIGAVFMLLLGFSSWVVENMGDPNG